MKRIDDDLFEFLEKITVTKDFGVQLLTTYTLGRANSIFILITHIHDVVISEVIQNVRLIALYISTTPML